MASDGSDEDFYDYDDEEASDIDYDDGDSSIEDGTTPFRITLTCVLQISTWIKTWAYPLF
jgi:hypothetical protein